MVDIYSRSFIIKLIFLSSFILPTFFMTGCFYFKSSGRFETFTCEGLSAGDSGFGGSCSVASFSLPSGEFGFEIGDAALAPSSSGI